MMIQYIIKFADGQGKPRFYEVSAPNIKNAIDRLNIEWAAAKIITVYIEL